MERLGVQPVWWVTITSCATLVIPSAGDPIAEPIYGLVEGSVEDGVIAIRLSRHGEFGLSVIYPMNCTQSPADG